MYLWENVMDCKEFVEEQITQLARNILMFESQV
jgi:hypothetical protein